jgi:replicative DNA helicase
MQTQAPYYVAPPEPSYYDDAQKVAGRTEEAALIGSVLRRPQLFEELRETVSPESFGWHSYGDAWQAMMDVSAAGMTIDPLTVGDELERKGKLADWKPFDSLFSGRAGLSEVREQGQPQHARSYAEIVQDYAAKRELMTIASTLAIWSANGRKAADILNDTEKKLAGVKVGAGKAAKHTATIKEAITKAVDRTDRASRGEITYIPTGFRALDDIITGLSAPDLVICAGRPKMGKTAFMASVAWNAMQTGKRIAFFTLEMGMEQIAMRFISMISGVSYSKQLTGKLSDSDWTLYFDAAEKLSDINFGLILNDMPAISPNKVRQELRRIGQVDLIVFDYIQLASADDNYQIRNLEVAANVKALKEICKEFDVPMLAAAQLNRAAEARAQSDKHPILSDLGESDELGKSADKVLFIHGDAQNSTEREIIVAAQRNGPTGICTLKYIGYKTRFESQ